MRSFRVFTFFGAFSVLYFLIQPSAFAVNIDARSPVLEDALLKMFDIGATPELVKPLRTLSKKDSEWHWNYAHTVERFGLKHSTNPRSILPDAIENLSLVSTLESYRPWLVFSPDELAALFEYLVPRLGRNKKYDLQALMGVSTELSDVMLVRSLYKPLAGPDFAQVLNSFREAEQVAILARFFARPYNLEHLRPPFVEKFKALTERDPQIGAQVLRFAFLNPQRPAAMDTPFPSEIVDIIWQNPAEFFEIISDLVGLTSQETALEIHKRQPELRASLRQRRSLGDPQLLSRRTPEQRILLAYAGLLPVEQNRGLLRKWVLKNFKFPRGVAALLVLGPEGSNLELKFLNKEFAYEPLAPSVSSDGVPPAVRTTHFDCIRIIDGCESREPHTSLD